MSSEGLRRLKVWAAANELGAEIYEKIIPELPEDEKYVLNQQLHRAAVSVPANIAEGYGRFYYQDNIRFCYIARGSLEETINYLILMRDLNYLSQANSEETLQKADLLVHMLNGYIAYLKRTKQGENEFPGGKSIREQSESYLVEGELEGISEPPESQ